MSQHRSDGTPAPTAAPSSQRASKPAPRRLYELSLHGSIPAPRHDQVLHILTGVAGHPPNRVRERHAVFRPNKVVSRQSAADQGGGSQTIQDNAKLAAAKKRAQESGRDGHSWLMRAVQPGAEDDGAGADTLLKPWSWRWYGMPDPNVKTVNARPTEWTDVDAQLPEAYAEAQDYRLHTEYIVAGEQFVHNNIVLQLYRVFQWPQDAADRTDLAGQPLADLATVDPSGGYLLEARLMLADGTKNELVTKGAAELAQFRDMMQGSIELRPVDRLALDTRARS